MQISCYLKLTKQHFFSSLLSLPATFGALYFAVWVGHRIKASQTHDDIKNIKKAYIEDPKCGFWIAQLLSDEATAKKAPKGSLIK